MAFSEESFYGVGREGGKGGKGFLRQRSTSLVKSVGDTFPSPLCGGARRALALVGGVFFRIVLDAQELQEVLRMVTSIILQRNGEVPA